MILFQLLSAIKENPERVRRRAEGGWNFWEGVAVLTRLWLPNVLAC